MPNPPSEKRDAGLENRVGFFGGFFKLPSSFLETPDARRLLVKFLCWSSGVKFRQSVVNVEGKFISPVIEIIPLAALRVHVGRLNSRIKVGQSGILGSCFCCSQHRPPLSSPPLSKNGRQNIRLVFLNESVCCLDAWALDESFSLTAPPPFSLLLPRSTTPKFILHLFHFSLLLFFFFFFQMSTSAQVFLRHT